MKNPMEVLRMKEQEIVILRREIEALQITARLLNDDGHPGGNNNSNNDRPDLRHLVEMP